LKWGIGPAEWEGGSSVTCGHLVTINGQW